MATEQDDIGTEEDLWAEAASGQAPKFESAPEPQAESVPEPEVTPEPEGTKQPRDEASGQFKAKSQEPEPSTETEPPTQETPAEAAPAEGTQAPAEDRGEGSVPPWRLRELREARDAERARASKAEAEAADARRQWEQSQRQLADFQKQIEALKAPKVEKEPINLFEQPDQFVGSIEQRLADQGKTFESEMRKIRLENNLALAAVVYKDEFQPAYDAFVKAAENDAGVRTRVFASSDPGGAIVSWHREQSTLREIGTDPNAYVQKKLEEALSNPEFLAKALERAKAHASGHPAPGAPAGQPAARPNVKTELPPSLRKTPGTAGASDGSGIENLSEGELFSAAVPR